MSENKKFKVLLLQIEGLEFLFRKSSVNFPLAAGFLKTMAYKKGLLNQVDIEILHLDHNRLSLGDAALIDLIISKKPDVLGFSIYCFNSIQSISIAEEVKKQLPNLIIIAGGPEVTLETDYILNSPAIDIGCLGQGELTFVEIIEHLIANKKDYSNIKGIFYRENGNIVTTPPSEPIKDLDQIPSPYVLNFVDITDYKTGLIETVRGCYFKCAYCSHGTRPTGFFSANRVYEELEVFLKNDVERVFILDSNFLASPNFDEVCEKIKDLNKEKKIELYATIAVEHLDEKRADLLKDCNFTEVEIGLQSIHQATLKNVNRPPVDTNKYLKGVQLLRERGIAHTAGVILGLPVDTLSDFEKSVMFLINNKVPGLLHLLQLFPNTRLRKKADEYGIKYVNKPPYLITETSYLSKSEIEKVVTMYDKIKNLTIDVFTGTFIDCFNPNGLLSGEQKHFESLPASPQFDFNVDKVILDLDASHADKLKELGEKLSRVVCQPFTAWFKIGSLEDPCNLIESLLLPIRAANPFLHLNIILEASDVFSSNWLEKIEKNIFSENRLYSFDSRKLIDTMSINVISPWKNNEKINQCWDNVKKEISLIWSFELSDKNDWQKEIESILKNKYGHGVLIDFNKTSNMDFIVNAVKYLHREANVNKKKIVYSNLAIDYISAFVNREMEAISITHIEAILSIDKNMNITPMLKPDKDVEMNLKNWKTKIQEYFIKK
ncbi:MAG: B12-binding domain-containing radical SAM protein [Desulfobacterales bacterium]|nr:B12-binding domain-containing radical SAM protein [Desulfobacterales bacterium]